jgi:hypothetical protein
VLTRKQKELLSFMLLGVRGNWLDSHRQPLDPLWRREIKDRILIPAIVFPPILELPLFFFLYSFINCLQQLSVSTLITLPSRLHISFTCTLMTTALSAVS